MNITASGPYAHKSTWALPTQGSPTFVPDGVLTAAHFQGMPTVQVWNKTAAYAPGFFDSQLRFLGGGSYWTPATTPKVPIEVLPWAALPLVPDANMPTGKSVWPVPPFEMKGQTGLKCEFYAEGDYGASVLEIFDCHDCDVTVYLRGTAAWLLVNKGIVNMETKLSDCRNTRVRVVCGTAAGQIVVRGLGVSNPTVIVESGVSVKGRAWDAAIVHLNPRYRSGATELYSDAGGSVECYGKQLPFDAVVDGLWRFGLNQPHCSVYGDEWWRAGVFETDGDAYLCGPDNIVNGCRICWLDQRQGSGWDAKKKLCTKWPTDLRGTMVLKGATWVMK